MTLKITCFNFFFAKIMGGNVLCFVQAVLALTLATLTKRDSFRSYNLPSEQRE